MSQNWSTPSLSSVNTAAELSFKIIFSGVLCHVTIYWNCVCTSLFMLNSPVLVLFAFLSVCNLQTPDEDDPWVCSWPTLSVSGVTKAGSGCRSALLWRSIVTPAQPAATLALNWQVILAEITQYLERKLLLKLTWYWSFLISRNSSPDHFSKNFKYLNCPSESSSTKHKGQRYVFQPLLIFLHNPRLAKL